MTDKELAKLVTELTSGAITADYILQTYGVTGLTAVASVIAGIGVGSAVTNLTPIGDIASDLSELTDLFW